MIVKKGLTKMRKFLFIFAIFLVASSAYGQDTPTVTNTPANTATFTITSTPTLTNTPVNTATRTPTVKRIGGQTDLDAWLVGSFALDPASVTANQRAGEDVDILGLQVGDVVILEPPSTLHVGLGYCGNTVVTNNRLKVFLCNHTGGNINDTELTWRYRVWNRTADETE